MSKTIKCPTCGRLTQREGNANRPFCSERCKLIDFGHWADEDYTFPADGLSSSIEDTESLPLVPDNGDQSRQ